MSPEKEITKRYNFEYFKFYILMKLHDIWWAQTQKTFTK